MSRILRLRAAKYNFQRLFSTSGGSFSAILFNDYLLTVKGENTVAAKREGQRGSVKLISMEESWKASTFLTSNFSLDFSKRPGRLYPPRTWTLYKMEKGNFYYETFESSIRRPLTPFVE